ncbi:MAG TPA: nuclear transport factor 2 family protein [Thermomicrobiaceae bacterium]|nr:nuclear transport factor 2 family protein [Thermomicrobiaceae bacterium]
MSAEEVRQASDRIYAALNRVINGDASLMPDVWSHADDVSTMHPLGGQQSGWDDVRGGWEMAAGAIRDGKATVSDQQVFVLGDVAYTIGIEHASATIGGTQASFAARCTNIHRREGDGWKLAHHHLDLQPEARAAVLAALGQAG